MNIQTKHPRKKLVPRFHRPYLVVELIRPQAYLLKLWQQVSIITDVSHVLLLEPYVSDWRSAPELPQPIKMAGKDEYKLEKILQIAYQYNAFCYWVKYKGYSAAESK